MNITRRGSSPFRIGCQKPKFPKRIEVCTITISSNTIPNRFEDKIRKGKAVDHKAEKRVVETVKMLKADGMSLRKIAKILDQMKIPTKCRGKSWHPEMVKRVLNQL